jgi:hypothetical protein
MPFATHMKEGPLNVRISDLKTLDIVMHLVQVSEVILVMVVNALQYRIWQNLHNK